MAEDRVSQSLHGRAGLSATVSNQYLLSRLNVCVYVCTLYSLCALQCCMCVISHMTFVSVFSVRDAPNPVQIRRHVHPQSFHLSVRQLLLVSRLHCLLQGQVGTALPVAAHLQSSANENIKFLLSTSKGHGFHCLLSRFSE